MAIEATLEHAVEAGIDASMHVLDAGLASFQAFCTNKR